MAMRAHAIHEATPFAASAEQFDSLTSKLQAASTWRMEHSELESLIEAEGRELMRRLLQDHLALRARHESEHDVVDQVVGGDGVARTHRREGERGLMTLFGPVRVARMEYGGRGADSLHPMDAALNLPSELYSHGVRRRVAREAAGSSFDSALETVLETTGAAIAKRQVEELTRRAAKDFEGFYRARSIVSAIEETTSGPLLVLTMDGKGVVMRRSDLREATRKAAESRTPKLEKRTSKGEKRNAKRMATVAAVYTLKPQVRTAEDIVGDLRGVVDVEKRAARPRPEHKRVWASLVRTPEEVIRDAFDEGARRDAAGLKRWVALVDGNKPQLAILRQEARRRGIQMTIIVDVIHVIEYLWKAAWCFFQEGDPGAQTWVTERLRRVLSGECSQVAAGIRRSATKRALSNKRRKPVDACAKYLLGYKAFLRYDEYLADGLPIATGVIEGACRHLVRDRMDITGARWGLEGAEAVLQLRSLRSSGDFDDYWRFHLEQERLKNHLMNYTGIPPRMTPPEKTPTGAPPKRHLRLVK